MIFLLAFAFWYILEMSLIDNTKSHLGGEIYARNKIRKYFIHFIHVFLMVYAMIFYNIALNMGGMSNQVFLLAFHELVIM